MYKPNEIDFKSKLDLDYESFANKKIHRCEICENIYYASSACLHNCLINKDNLSSINNNKPNYVTNNTNSKINKDKSELSKSEKLNLINNIRFYDEIYIIWKKKGFKRHKKIDIKETDKHQTIYSNDNLQKEKFSFSPYDNFF